MALGVVEIAVLVMAQLVVMGQQILAVVQVADGAEMAVTVVLE